MTAYDFAEGLKRGASKSLKRSQREIRRIGKGLGLVIRKQRSGDGLRNDYWEMVRNLINGCVEQGRNLTSDEMRNLLSGELVAPSRPPSRMRLQLPMATARKRRTIGPGFKIATPKMPTAQRRRNRR